MAEPIAFTKGHGTGNDFVIVPDDDGALDLSADQIAALCDRRFGIGGDGILRVVRSARLREGEATADAEWFMDYRNADGSAAEMCGNGTRVFAKYLVDTGRANIDDAPLRIGTRAGVKTLTRSDLGFEVDLGVFRVDGDVVVKARGLDVARPGQGVDVGNPHVVVALSSSAELDGLDLTVQPQLHPDPVEGANVEFVVPADPLVQNGVGTIRMRVFERGVGRPCRAAPVWPPPRWRSGTGRGPRRRTGGAWRCPAARSVYASSPRPTETTSCCPDRRRSSTRARSVSPEAGAPPAPAPGARQGSSMAPVRTAPCRRTFSTRNPRPVAARVTE